MSSKDLLNQYFAQDSLDVQTAYDNELRAEADLVAECCECLRVCCIFGGR